MKILLALFATIFSAGIYAQNAVTINDPDAKVRTLNGSFRAINVSDGISLILTAGSEESLAVSFADDKYAEKFKTEVVDGVLKIYFDNRGVNYNDNRRRKLKAYVSFKNLDNLIASGGASVKLPAAANLEKLDMKFTSGSTFEGKIKADEIMVDQTSGSVVTLSGTAATIKLNASSGAIFKGYDFTGVICNAVASSGGEVRVSVEKELSAKASSGGDIHYKGTAVIKDVNISSGGVVKKA